MTPELLTEDELETARDLTLEYPDTAAKLLRAYEALVQRVAELTAAHEVALGTLKCANDVSEEWERAYHTEKAAREAAIIGNGLATRQALDAESEAASLRAKLEAARKLLEGARENYDCESWDTSEIDTWLEQKP